MQPKAYIDFRVIPSFKSERPAGMAHDIIALLMKFSHAIAARQGFKFAAAFPQAKVAQNPTPGNLLRIFAMDRDQLDTLADELEKQSFVRDYVTVGRVKVLPADFQAKEYVEFLRFRIPNRNSFRQDYRAKRMEEANSLPHLRLNSSAGHGFSIFVKPVLHRTSDCSDGVNKFDQAGFAPDIYGLSVYERRFALPILPDDHWPYGSNR